MDDSINPRSRKNLFHAAGKNRNGGAIVSLNKIQITELNSLVLWFDSLTGYKFDDVTNIRALIEIARGREYYALAARLQIFVL